MAQQRDEDEIDTARVVLRENTRVEFQSTTLSPRSTVRLVVVPEQSMENPVLFMSQEPADADVLVEQIAVGHFIIVAPGRVSDYKFGEPLRETVTPQKPLRILLRSEGPLAVKVGASLVTTEKPGTYRIADRERLNKG